MEELVRNMDAGPDLALRWLTALAVAHCRPRPATASSAVGASGHETCGDADMADAAPGASVGAEDGGTNRPNGVQGRPQAAAAADGAANDAVTPNEAGPAEAASQAGAAQPWSGLAGSPYEAALLALVKACRWRGESLSSLQLMCSSFGPLHCQGQGTASLLRRTAAWLPQEPMWNHAVQPPSSKTILANITRELSSDGSACTLVPTQSR